VRKSDECLLLDGVMFLFPTHIRKRLAHLWWPLSTLARATLLLRIVLSSLGLVQFALVIP
jgi:hypothetical protein